MICDQDGFNPRFEGATFENGDICEGYYIEEDNKRFWIVKDKDGNEYETEETPCIRINLT